MNINFKVRKKTVNAILKERNALKKTQKKIGGKIHVHWSEEWLLLKCPFYNKSSINSTQLLPKCLPPHTEIEKQS